jgi:hypothetical protein
MANRLGPLEIDCDAPRYEVVRACQKVGFHSPLDVRWCRLGRFLEERARREKEPSRVLRWFTRPGHPTCYCGQGLPDFTRCEFLYPNGVSRTFRLGQCPRCRAIFWEAAGR